MVKNRHMRTLGREVWDIFKKKEVPMLCVKIIQDLYNEAKMNVKSVWRNSFMVKIGVH